MISYINNDCHPFTKLLVGALERPVSIREQVRFRSQQVTFGNAGFRVDIGLRPTTHLVLRALIVYARPYQKSERVYLAWTRELSVHKVPAVGASITIALECQATVQSDSPKGW